MEIFRIGHDVYGQRVLEGVSWSMLGVAVGAGAVVILGHLIYTLMRGKRGA